MDSENSPIGHTYNSALWHNFGEVEEQEKTKEQKKRKLYKIIQKPKNPLTLDNDVFSHIYTNINMAKYGNEQGTRCENWR